MLIRKATIKDIEHLQKMGQDFFKASGFESMFVYDEPTCRLTLEHLIQDDSGTIYVMDNGKKPVGMVGALLYPFYMNQNVLQAQELFWWINPENRKGLSGVKLLQGVENWAKEKGAVAFNMMCLEHLEPEKIERLLTVKGYNKTERHFMRIL